MELQYVAAARSEAGRRPANEDYYAVDPAIGLYVVADGTASRGGGDTAARIACDTVQQLLNEQAPTLDPGNHQQVAKVMEQTIVAANEQILAAQATDANLARMATTIVVALMQGDSLHLGYAGDSRAYLYRNGELTQLTRDHSLENYLKDNPHLRPKQQRSGKTLLSALGLKREQLKVDCVHQTIERDDLLILCSDGLTDGIPDWIIREILAGAYISTTIEDTAGSLVRSSLAHGGMDNITVLLVHATEDKQVGDGHTVIFEPDAVPGALAPASRILGWLTRDSVEDARRGEVIALDKRMSIGASPKCAIQVVGDDFVSSRHAEVVLTEFGFVARDLDSTNGCYVNKARIKHETLVDGDVLRVGTTRFIFKSYRS